MDESQINRNSPLKRLLPQRLSPLQRIACMFTIINLFFVLTFSYYPSDIQDIIRATTLLILVVVATIWLSGNITCVYGELYDSFLEHPNSTEIEKHFIVFLADVALHIVPVIVLGTPHSYLSVIIAYGLLLVWYTALGNKIGQIYTPSVNGKRAIALGGLFTTGYAAFLYK